MTEHTIVVRFPEGVTPAYSAATEFQGGQVVAVDFSGNRLAVEQELEEVIEELLEAVGELSPEAEQIVANARAALDRAKEMS